MSTLFQEHQALLDRQLAVLQRLRDGLRFSAGRLRWPISATDIDDPEAAERLAALNDRFAKLQDQLAGAMRHAHTMLGERYRSYFDVITWMTREEIIASPEVWLELRTLRNQLTHDYDLDVEVAVKYLNALRDNIDKLTTIVGKFEGVCQKYGLLPGLDRAETAAGGTPTATELSGKTMPDTD